MIATEQAGKEHIGNLQTKFRDEKEKHDKLTAEKLELERVLLLAEEELDKRSRENEEMEKENAEEKKAITELEQAVKELEGRAKEDRKKNKEVEDRYRRLS